MVRDDFRCKDPLETWQSRVGRVVLTSRLLYKDLGVARIVLAGNCLLQKRLLAECRNSFMSACIDCKI